MLLSQWRSMTLTVLFIFTFAACETDMKVSSDGKLPPTFTLSGSGSLNFFVVMEVPAENQTQTIQRESDRNILLGRIRPEPGNNKIYKIPPIRYGKVPEGFVQEFPVQGPPTPLLDGKVYEIGGTAYNANGGFVWIRVHSDKTIEVPVPGS